MDTDRKPNSSAEFIRFGFFEDSSRIEGLHARFDQHQFSTHAHDTWAIGAVVSGSKDVSARRGPRQIVNAGECYSLPPHRPHAGKTVDAHCEYVMLYVPDTEWRAQCAAYSVDPDHFSTAASKQPQLVRHLASFVSMLLCNPEMLAKWSGEWSTFCETMLTPYSRSDSVQSSSAISRANRDPAVVRAHDYLREFWNQNVSSVELANVASTSTYELCRRFSRVYGMTPHRYQLVLRVINAKSKLLQGASISDVASDTGFSDQSHLGRHFKSVFGLTPGAVAKEVVRARQK
jgi:AraC-like DNA-binding protein